MGVFPFIKINCFTMNSPVTSATTILLLIALIDLSTTNIESLGIVGFIESPTTLTKKVDDFRLIRRSSSDIDFVKNDSHGLGKPADTACSTKISELVDGKCITGVLYCKVGSIHCI
jgi:hypothetical protein